MIKKAWVITGFVLLAISCSAQRLATIDSLKNVADTLDDPHKQAEIYNLISMNYWRISPDTSIFYGNMALEIASKNEYTAEQSRALYHTGIARVYRGDFDMAIRNLQQALQLATNSLDSLGMAKIYGGIAFAYKRVGLYENSLEYYLKSLDVTEQIGDLGAVAYMLNNIGNIHYTMNNYDLALNYYNRALSKMELVGDEMGIPFALNNIGNVYKNLGNYDSAMFYYNNSLILKVEINDTWGAGSTLNNMGKVSYSLGKYRLAEEYFQRSTRLMMDAGDKYKYTEACIDLAKTYLKLGKYESARDKINECRQLTGELGSSQLMLELYRTLADYHKATGNPAQSNEYLERIIKLNDSLSKQEISTRIAEIQNVYELEKKDQQIQVLKKDQQINVLKLHRQETLRNFLIMIALIFLLSGFMIYREYRKKTIAHREIKKINSELEEQKEKISLQNDEIRLQRDELERLNNTKDKLFSIISHDLKSPFNALLGFSYLLNNDYDSMQEEERKEIIGYINQAIHDTYSLTQNLLYWARSQTGGIKIRKEPFDLKNLILEVTDTLRPSADKKNIDIELENTESLEVSADRNLLDIVVRNLVSNSIKFTEDDGKISLAYYTSNSNLKIIIEDTGIGIPKDKLDKLFKTGESVSTKGTKKEAGTGLGLIVCKEFVEMHGGELKIKSEVGKGTTALISLPS